MAQRYHRRAWLAAVCLAFALPAGCFEDRINNAPVEADKARGVLRTALESWKNGDKVDALQTASPPIYVIDSEWESGAVLKDYRIVSDGEEKDAHLFCEVKLTVQGSGGRPVEREVTYVISTAPNLTVSRKVF